MKNLVNLLPKKAIEEYIAIYKQAYGIELTYKQAQIDALEFLNFFKVVYQPIKKRTDQKCLKLS